MSDVGIRAGGGVVLRVEAVVRRYPLQAAERGLAAPRMGQSVAALEALDALEGVLATELTYEGRRGEGGMVEKRGKSK
ncbi:hypothetical protein EYF80_014711 [Liparis tanakae]|uniref:Uncharacterized protein n=1 Tax=Liparis tanakae TaxID=230148 RepID=A0A4Z2IAA7_9TELE|nr:hypothetical protein EYF80_014711 [Liparis tanakae]